MRSEISKGLKLHFTLISRDVLNSKIRGYRLITFVRATLELASGLKCPDGNFALHLGPDALKLG